MFTYTAVYGVSLLILLTLLFTHFSPHISRWLFHPSYKMWQPLIGALGDLSLISGFTLWFQGWSLSWPTTSLILILFTMHHWFDHVIQVEIYRGRRPPTLMIQGLMFGLSLLTIFFILNDLGLISFILTCGTPNYYAVCCSCCKVKYVYTSSIWPLVVIGITIGAALTAAASTVILMSLEDFT